MIITSKRRPETALTVSDVPSSDDRALFGDEAGELGRRLESEARHVAVVAALDNSGDAVDMAADEMATELIAELQRAARD